MRSLLRACLVGVLLWLGLAVVAQAAPPLSPLHPAGRLASASTWGAAEEVPGTATLNAGSASVISVSCPGAGSCAAGGFFDDRASHQQPFVVHQAKGIWGKAEEVPGIATLNAGGLAQLYSVSCASAGNCAAGGYYKDRSDQSQAFVVNEVGGVWHKAEEVPGLASLDAGESFQGLTQVDSISCASAGNCAASGLFADSAGFTKAFVVNEVNGKWHTAEEVPGMATLNHGYAEATSVSCAEAGDCAAGGYYADGSGNEQAFVVNETNGNWGNADEVPGTVTLNSDGYAGVSSLSCSSAGNCGAGGFYEDGSGFVQLFVVDEVDGSWGNAKEVPHIATLNADGLAEINSLSCSSAGNCAAGGYYRDGSNHFQAFVVNELMGTWGSAKEVPGTATLNKTYAKVSSLSCASAGTCAAGGLYTSGAAIQAFVVNEVKGVWGRAEEVPGTAKLNVRGNAQVASLSCASAANCVAGGFYRVRSGHTQAFVAPYR